MARFAANDQKKCYFPDNRRSQDGSQQSDPVLKRFHATKTHSGHRATATIVWEYLALLGYKMRG